ncbi:MAG: LamG domain-containing protein [Kofleriaceae bacterium]|nr:LamG domain-containing protein [Kofleriaceae bacterium]
MLWLGLVALLSACGRLEFDSESGHPDVGAPQLGAQRDPRLDHLEIMDATPSDVGLDPGLRLWLRFAPGDLLRDSVTGVNASCSSCPVATGGPGRDAASFTGTECLFLSDRPELHSQTFSIAAWIRPGNVGTAFAKAVGDSILNSWEIRWSAAEHLHLNTSDGASNNGLSSAVYMPGTWLHVVGTFDRGTTAIFTNGAFVDEHTRTLSVDFDDHPVSVGCDLDSGVLDELITADLADIRFYDRVLTPSEIADLASE